MAGAIPKTSVGLAGSSGTASVDTDNCRGSQALSFRGYDSVLDLIPENQLVKPDRLGGTDGLVPYPARAYYYFDDKDVQVVTHSWPATSLASEFMKVTLSRFVPFSCTGIIFLISPISQTNCLYPIYVSFVCIFQGRIRVSGSGDVE